MDTDTNISYFLFKVYASPAIGPNMVAAGHPLPAQDRTHQQVLVVVLHASV